VRAGRALVVVRRDRRSIADLVAGTALVEARLR
jgi:uncharacterized RDD family membrane protein YckC